LGGGSFAEFLAETCKRQSAEHEAEIAEGDIEVRRDQQEIDDDAS
jgi:hypothetical protein